MFLKEHYSSLCEVFLQEHFAWTERINRGYVPAGTWRTKKHQCELNVGRLAVAGIKA